MNSKQYQYSIKDIVSHNIKDRSTPKSKLPKELLIYNDIVFNQFCDPLPKEHLSRETDNEEKLNLFSYLIFDNKYKKVSVNIHNWKKTGADEKDDTNDFFDNFKGKFKDSDVQNFKKNAQLSLSMASNISIVNNQLFDYEDFAGFRKNNKEGLNKEGTMLNNKTGQQGVGIDVDDFFGSGGGGPQIQEDSYNYFKKSTNYMKLPLVDCVYIVNDKINYPRNQPLWYVYHTEAESSYGPLSSEEIEQMINSKLLDAEGKIRLIDVFLYRGCKQFEFFYLKDILLDNFADSIKVSNLAYNFKINNSSNSTYYKDTDSFGKSKFYYYFN